MQKTVQPSFLSKLLGRVTRSRGISQFLFCGRVSIVSMSRYSAQIETADNPSWMPTFIICNPENAEVLAVQHSSC